MLGKILGSCIFRKWTHSLKSLIYLSLQVIVISNYDKSVEEISKKVHSYTVLGYQKYKGQVSYCFIPRWRDSSGKTDCGGVGKLKKVTKIFMGFASMIYVDSAFNFHGMHYKKFLIIGNILSKAGIS